MTHKTKIKYHLGLFEDPQAVCSCGWRGVVRSFRWAAGRDAKKHWKAVAGYDAS